MFKDILYSFSDLLMWCYSLPQVSCGVEVQTLSVCRRNGVSKTTYKKFVLS